MGLLAPSIVLLLQLSQSILWLLDSLDLQWAHVKLQALGLWAVAEVGRETPAEGRGE